MLEEPSETDLPFSITPWLHSVQTSYLVGWLASAALIVVLGLATVFTCCGQTPSRPPPRDGFGGKVRTSGGDARPSDRPTQCEGFGECVYFSLVTFSSLGYGDLSPARNLRILAAFEAILGVLFVGMMGGLVVFRVLRPNVRLEFSPIVVMVDDDANGRIAFAMRHSHWRGASNVRVQAYVVLAEAGASERTWIPLTVYKEDVPHFTGAWGLDLILQI